jgi:hypothetical protein
MILYTLAAIGTVTVVVLVIKGARQLRKYICSKPTPWLLPRRPSW